MSRSSAFSSRRPLVEHARDDRDDQVLGEVHRVVERGVGHLGLDHPELGEVPARLRLLGAERRTERVDAAERHRVRLVVELSALREVGGGVLEVLDREQRGRALARRGREDRRVGEDEAARVEEVAAGVDDLVPDAQDRLLPRRADPQVAPVHQVVDAVLLRRDGVVVRLADDLEAADVELVAARRAGIGADRAGHDDGALLAEVIGRDEDLGADRGLRHHRLDEAGAVADGQEVQLPARPPVVQPALERDGLADVPGDVLDVGRHGDYSKLVDVRQQQFVQPREARIALQRIAHVAQRARHVLDVDRVLARRRLVAEGAHRLQVALQRHQVEAGAEVGFGDAAALERQEVGDQLVDRDVVQVDVGIAQQRGQVVGVRAHARVLEVDQVELTLRQHQVAAVVVAVAEHARLGRQLLDDHLELAADGVELGLRQHRVAVRRQVVPEEEVQLPGQLLDVEGDAVGQVGRRRQRGAARLHRDDVRDRLAVERGVRLERLRAEVRLQRDVAEVLQRQDAEAVVVAEQPRRRHRHRLEQAADVDEGQRLGVDRAGVHREHERIALGRQDPVVLAVRGVAGERHDPRAAGGLAEHGEVLGDAILGLGERQRGHGGRSERGGQGVSGTIRTSAARRSPGRGA